MRNISSPEVSYCLGDRAHRLTQYEIQVAAYNGGPAWAAFSRAVAEYTLQGGEPARAARSSPLEKLDVPGSVGARELINSLNV